ncbi:MAG: Crp/Fnr family transcriptional regulator [Chitinophagales bacterium]
MKLNPIQQLKEQLDQSQLWTHTVLLKRNEYLCLSGNVDTNLYYVTEGSLRVFFADENEEHTIRFAYKNSFIAALDSFITNAPGKYYIQAIRKTEVKAIDKKAYINFINCNQENTRLWHTLLEQMILQQMEREIDILISSPYERYQRVLKRSPQLFQEIPHKYIAAYLRMTPETLSRIKKS